MKFRMITTCMAVLFAAMMFGMSCSGAGESGDETPALPSGVAAENCGDGNVDADEGCDDGGVAPGDGCDELCRVETATPICGNGTLESGEECDDSNTVAGDGCDASCMNEVAAAVCGNGVIEVGEGCDDSNTTAGDGCDELCRVETATPVCGNGILESTEECDDGNATAGDGCDASCMEEVVVSPTCGDGTVDTGEACDDGVNNSDTVPDACRMTCVAASCGDNVVDAGEGCDDGNVAPGDGCDDLCHVETATPVCGNTIIESGEECDDGNVTPGDGCDVNCIVEVIEFPEVKDLIAVLPNSSELFLVANKVVVNPMPTHISPLSSLKIIFDGPLPATPDPEVILKKKFRTDVVGGVTTTRDSDTVISIAIDSRLHHNEKYTLRVERRRTLYSEFRSYYITIGNAGDFDGDGYSDIVVGAPNPFVTTKGAAFLYIGSSSANFPADCFDADLKLHASIQGTRFGGAVAMGDVNGDGRADLAVGAPSESCVYIFLGKDVGDFPSNKILKSADSDSKLRRTNGTASHFGSSLAIGDVNGDKFADLIVGEPEARGIRNTSTTIDGGAVHVFYGSSTGIDSVNLANTSVMPSAASFSCQAEVQHAGFSVATGDVNGDGIDDILVGGPGQNLGGLFPCRPGRVFIILGGNDLANRDGDYTLTDTMAVYDNANCSNITDRFGGSVAAITIPGKDRLGVGAKNQVFKYEYDSQNLLDITPFVQNPPPLPDYQFVVADLIDAYGIGMPNRSKAIRKDDLNNLHPWMVGQSSTSEFGWALSPAAEIDRDGIKDFVVTERNYQLSSQRYGAVHIYSGYTLLGTIEGNFAVEFGYSVAGGRLR